MDFLTRQLAKIVYSVDLTRLPDEAKTNRGRRLLRTYKRNHYAQITCASNLEVCLFRQTLSHVHDFFH